MVRYTKNSGNRPFRRKLKFKNTKHITSVLATLTPDQFEHLKRYARHYLGTHPIEGVPTHHDKVLPSTDHCRYTISKIVKCTHRG